MRAMPQLRRSVALALAVVLFVLTGPIDAARAALVTTEQALAGEARRDDRDRVAAFLARDDVRAQMVALGVDPAEAAQPGRRPVGRRGAAHRRPSRPAAGRPERDRRGDRRGAC